MDGAVDVGEVTIRFEDLGEGPPVVLLHGAPDSGRLWRYQVPRLHDAGFRTIVPDLRGFGRSSRPQEVDQYRMELLVGDVLAVMRRAGISRAHLVGHDWGGQVAWVLASMLPRAVDHLVVIASAHPRQMWAPSIEQRARSWYLELAQSPHAEALLSRDDFALLRALTREQGDVDAHLRDLARPGALTAWLNWCRANAGADFHAGPPPRLPAVVVPTLTISSPGDEHFEEADIAASAQYVTGPYRHLSVAGASHWIQLDVPEVVSHALCDFLAEPLASAAPPRRGRRR